jgi:hypothetical protein
MASTAYISYIRFDGTTIPPPTGSLTTQNFLIQIYHVNGSTLPSDLTLSSLRTFVANTKVIRQNINTSSIINNTICEWDNLTTSINNMDSNSALIMFVVQKSVVNGKVVNNFIDYYCIPSFKSVVQNNINLVYNTDNYYLLEMNATIDAFNNLNPKPTKSPSGLTISSNSVIQTNYDNIYFGVLDTEIMNQVNIQIAATGQTYSPSQLAQLQQQYKAQILADPAQANNIETQAMVIFNAMYKDTFYKKYVGDQSYSNVDVINLMNKNIYNMKCLLPFSKVARTNSDESAVRLSIHYTM